MLCGVGISLGVAVAVGVTALRRQEPCPVCNATTHSLCTRGACPLCNCSILKGEVETLQVSVVCAECTLQHFKNEGPNEKYIYTVSEFDAIRKFGCSSSDLCHLRHGYFSNFDGSVFERRYLWSEVWYLRNLRRKAEVERQLECQLKTIHPHVRHFLLGDYLSSLGQSKTKMKDILRYKKVLHRANAIVEQCPRAHPKAALDFCLMHPAAGPTEFQEMKKKMHKVFHLEGRRILHGLSEKERKVLNEGPLRDDYKAFNAQDSDSLIRRYLSEWFSHNSIDMIMADDSWKHFDWGKGPEDRVASKLRDFWKEKLRRKTKLMQALTAKGLSIPESCFDCEGYMNGINTLDLKEIVAVVQLTTRLTKLGFRVGDLEWCIGFDRLFRCLKRQEMRPAKSVNAAVRAAVQSQRK